MRFAFLLLYLLCTSPESIAQTTLVKVIFTVEDFDTRKGMPGALVQVRQTASTQPTLADGKVSFNNVPVGEIEYYIMKEGYQFETGRVNVSTDEKTNIFRIPISKIDDKKILVTGEVTDGEGRDVKDALVEVKIADQMRTVMTDASGNYSVDISPSAKFPSSNMRIEVKKGDCKKTETVDIPRNNVVYKDFNLGCTSESNENGEKSKPQTPLPEYIYEDNYFSIVYKDLKRQGSNLQLRLIVTAKNDDRNIQIAGGGNWDNSTRVFDNSNNKYLVSATKIANSIAEKGHNNIMSLVKDIPTELLLTFEQFPTGTIGIPLLELWFSNRPNTYGSYQLVKFRNIK